jgi:transcriptional regulator with XRE-family HTH domain
VSRRVRRADRHRRCPRCGFEAHYPKASVKEANRWFRRHSCQKREDAMVRSVQYAQRLELIDRTPKPCLHKLADHQHGTNAAYVLDGCRCEPCRVARMEQDRWRNRQKAYGRYAKYVDAEPVRAHLAELRDYGIGLKRVSEVSGVSNGSLTKIWYGLYAGTGRGHEDRRGEGVLVREPSHRVLRTTAERIYAVEPIPANLGTRQPDHERTPTARLHLQALVALGWSQSKLAQRLGILPTNLGPVIGTSTAGGPNRREGLRVLSRSTVDAIEALYDELSMTLPPATNQRERISVSRAKRYAAQHGWLPPLALEDTDTPDEGTDVDLIAIERRLAGDKSVPLNHDERVEVVRRTRAKGWSLRDIERIAGIAKAERYITETEQAS